MNTVVRLIVAALAIELRKAIVGAFSAKPKPPPQESSQPWPPETVDHVEAQIERGARAFPAVDDAKERAWQRHIR